MGTPDEYRSPPSALSAFGAYAGIFLLTAGAAYAGYLVSQPGSWYEALAKPPLTPPNAIFGPVWTTLYVLMALAACRAWYFGVTNNLNVAVPMTLYVTQLALNAAWSWLFFERHQIGWALVDILALWVLIVLTAFAFLRNAWSAGILFLPYLAWVSFATYLNYGLWRLNPDMIPPSFW